MSIHLLVKKTPIQDPAHVGSEAADEFVNIFSLLQVLKELFADAVKNLSGGSEEGTRIQKVNTPKPTSNRACNYLCIFLHVSTQGELGIDYTFITSME